ncbi:hypothetical protein MMMDOFMJ_4382 [Methylobacterium gnaphalii]|nr:hypothetical protein MMMDOFMJ_4382 [Methylobacterium gnaphalii]
MLIEGAMMPTTQNKAKLAAPLGAAVGFVTSLTTLIMLATPFAALA